MKSITLKTLLFCLVALLPGSFLFAQDNSPYSRYGLGDLTPRTNISTRGMGGISAAYADPLTINFANPASYAAFMSYSEQQSKKSASGRVLFDVGLNFDNHTLRQGNSADKFSSGNAVFSYMQLGVPVKRNWGLSFGLRQLSRIGYKIDRSARLVDPITGNPIDSTITHFTGDGGTFLATMGTGFAIKNFSFGFNFGYIFGRKQYDTKLDFLNDSVSYYSSDYTSQTSFGNIFANGGIQYKANIGKKMLLHLGASGNLQQSINASQDVVRETITHTANGDVPLDSIYAQKGVKGKINYPSSYTVGFTLEKKPDLQNNQYGNWQVGADMIHDNWSQYRFFGLQDSVQDSWQFRVGGQIRPQPKKNYFSNVTYRAGFMIGRDYIHVGSNLPLWGITFGMGLPIANYNNLARNQASIVNLALEYIRRGDNKSALKENVFRVSLGLALTDIWFIKKKYE
ncbi:MAG TPA: hypothetical protein VGC95_09985 [Chitinophagaceae bacterium]